jgi:hypothetical protein
VDANRVVASGFFEPVEEANVVTAVFCIVTSIVVDVDEFNLINKDIGWT